MRSGIRLKLNHERVIVLVAGLNRHLWSRGRWESLSAKVTKARKTDDTAKRLAQGSRPAGRKGGPGGLKERPIRIVAYITEALSDWLEEANSRTEEEQE